MVFIRRRHNLEGAVGCQKKPTIFVNTMFLLLIAGCITTTTTGFVSHVNVHIPGSLYKSGGGDGDGDGYDHRPSLFGFPPYDGSITEQVYYAGSDLCEPIVKNSWPVPFVLMADRGGCTFVTKTRNAQHAGASALVIADNSCLCSDQECFAANPDITTCETVEPILTDDGSAADISIPSMLLFKSDADKIKQQLMGGPTTNSIGNGGNNIQLPNVVLIELSWSSRRPLLSSSQAPDDGMIEYEFWFVPGDVASARFLNDFSWIAKALGDRAQFTPHFIFNDGTRLPCREIDSGCPNLCTNGGWYCGTPPHSFFLGSSQASRNGGSGAGAEEDAGEERMEISGSDVIVESLREICIWKYYGSPSDGTDDIWWNYVREFGRACLLESSSPGADFTNEDCINAAYQRAGVDGNKIARCIQDSGGVGIDDARNSILDMEFNSKIVMGVTTSPTLLVNGLKVPEQLTISNALKAICDSYPPPYSSDDGNKKNVELPRICAQKCFNCPDVLSCVRNDNGTCFATLSGADATPGSATSADAKDDDIATATLPPTTAGTITTNDYRVPAMDIGSEDYYYDDNGGVILDGVPNRSLFLGMLCINLFLVVLLVVLCSWILLCRQKMNGGHEYKAVNQV